MDHFDEFLAGIRYIICSYSNGKTPEGPGRYTAKIYELSGTSIEDTQEIYGSDAGATHARLELLGIEAALARIGPPEFPILCLSRQEYISKYASELRSNGFRTAAGDRAANADVWERIAVLDPDAKVEWHFVDRDLDEEIADRIAEQENEFWMQRAMERDPWG